MKTVDQGLRQELNRRELLRALRAFQRGDFSVRMPLDLAGVDGEIAAAFNDLVEMEETKAAEMARIAEQVGKEGRIGRRMNLTGAKGGWARVIESVNGLIDDMAYPMTEVARVMARWPRATCRRPWCSRRKAVRCAARPCASAQWSTPWSGS